jgi:hypothetical protein
MEHSPTSATSTRWERTPWHATQRDRRARLVEDVVAGSELVFPVGRLAPDGLEAWKQVVERGYEGYVAKDERSVYEGGATRRWLKVVPGWTDPEDRWRRVRWALVSLGARPSLRAGRVVVMRLLPTTTRRRPHRRQAARRRRSLAPSPGHSDGWKRQYP